MCIRDRSPPRAERAPHAEATSQLLSLQQERVTESRERSWSAPRRHPLKVDAALHFGAKDAYYRRERRARDLAMVEMQHEQRQQQAAGHADEGARRAPAASAVAGAVEPATVRVVLPSKNAVGDLHDIAAGMMRRVAGRGPMQPLRETLEVG